MGQDPHIIPRSAHIIAGDKAGGEVQKRIAPNSMHLPERRYAEQRDQLLYYVVWRAVSHSIKLIKRS